MGDDDPLVTGGPSCGAIRVLPRFDCQKPAALHLILTDPARARGDDRRIVALVRRHGYDGINIDFENGPATDRDALDGLRVQIGGTELHAIGKDLVGRGVGEVPAHDHRTVRPVRLRGAGAAADHVFVMNWGWHW